MTTASKLECAIEAIGAMGNTNRAAEWYAKWMPERFSEYGIGTTVQYSLSCALMDAAHQLLTGRRIPHDSPESDNTRMAQKLINERRHC